MGMRLAFTGDICFSNYFTGRWKDPACLTDAVKGYLAGADFVVANVEGALSTRSFSRSVGMEHISDPCAGRFLADHNMKIWNLSNNHMMDAGSEGLRDTLRCAQSNLCRTIGAGDTAEDAAEPVILGDQVKVGVLSVSKPWRWMSEKHSSCVSVWTQRELLRKKIRELREKVRWVVLVVHDGDEFSALPMPYVRENYLSFLDMGADVIVGHHPHVVQPYEKVGNKFIFYSLGNFIFDTDYQRSFANTKDGILLTLDFDDKAFSFDHMPIRIDRDAQRVAQGSTPAIFCEIGENGYRQLWKLAARRLYRINRKKWVVTQRRFKKANSILLSAHMLYGLRNKHNRIIALGGIGSYFGGWRKFSDQKVCDYLLHSIDQ